ncbi:TetR/AcrR family transcriptional regulator [Paraconexibacter antarcticus]|uniref:TetR/AcrR family transcriptional regulator n=1 Tax=Paraconexibacter antarcticus TaxID=2949664 RepID=A0ABY5DP29_9ACTN|nr:TetR/AcrR family transcriptional regulator [Paraconexibacter antarcticus]UTI63788.1 TetR/AcrR family transcriptional regulator [Paraconexibacter antarcticus]
MPAPRAPGRTRTQILDAAIALVAERGHAGVTMQGVADAAGVDKALLHYYFTNKAGLLAATVDQLGQRLLTGVEAAVAGLDDPSLVVEIGYGALWDHAVDEPALHAAWLSLYAASITTPELAEAVAAVRARYRAMVATRLDAMLAAGWQTVLSHGATVTMVVATIDGFTLALLDGGRTAELDEAIAAMQRMIAALIVRPAP